MTPPEEIRVKVQQAALWDQCRNEELIASILPISH